MERERERERERGGQRGRERRTEGERETNVAGKARLKLRTLAKRGAVLFGESDAMGLIREAQTLVQRPGEGETR